MVQVTQEESYAGALHLQRRSWWARGPRTRVQSRVGSGLYTHREICRVTGPEPIGMLVVVLRAEGGGRGREDGHTWQRSVLCGPACTCIRTPCAARVRNASPRYHGTDTAMSFPKSHLSVPLPRKWWGWAMAEGIKGAGSQAPPQGENSPCRPLLAHAPTH